MNMVFGMVAVVGSKFPVQSTAGEWFQKGKSHGNKMAKNDRTCSSFGVFDWFEGLGFLREKLPGPGLTRE